MLSIRFLLKFPPTNLTRLQLSLHIFLTFKILIVIIELINFNFQIPLVVLHCQALRFIWKIYLFESQLPPFRSSQHKKIFFLTHQHFLAIFFLCLHDGIFLEMFFFYSYSVFLFFLLSCLERRGLSFFIADLLEIFLTFGRVILVGIVTVLFEEDRLLQLRLDHHRWLTHIEICSRRLFRLLWRSTWFHLLEES